jgi:hypothetical protein
MKDNPNWTRHPKDRVKELERRLTVANRFIELVANHTLGDEDTTIQGTYEETDFKGAYEAMVSDARETLSISKP